MRARYDELRAENDPLTFAALSAHAVEKISAAADDTISEAQREYGEVLVAMRIDTIREERRS